jgi:hypothetical protein
MDHFWKTNENMLIEKTRNMSIKSMDVIFVSKKSYSSLKKSQSLKRKLFCNRMQSYFSKIQNDLNFKFILPQYNNNK